MSRPGNNMNKQLSHILSGLSLASLLSLSLGPFAFSAPYPGSGAPISCIRTTSSDGGDPTNPFSYPFLADIAKSLARSGFPASFFLGTDSARAPGIDLRTILLYETGILKSPVRFFVPSKKSNDDPFLSMGAIPDSPGTMPLEGPVLSTKGGLSAQEPGVVGGRNSAQNADGAKSDAALSLDLTKFSIDLNDASHKNEVTNKLKENLGSLAMALPLSIELPSMKHEADSFFRFWTVPAPVPSVSIREAGGGSTYREGSFVMMSPLGLKSIEGRQFFLVSGQILASSQGKSIVVDTPAARVNVEPGASAFVEIINPGTTRVRVLECNKGERSVGVKFKVEGKGEEIRLGVDDDLLIADHKLSDTDKNVQGKSGTASGADNWSKTSFSVKSLLDTDAFFSTDLANQNADQRQAIQSLKKRVK